MISDTLINTKRKSTFNPSVDALSSGGFVISWEASGESPDESDSGIFARLYDARGIAQSEEFLVNTFTDSFQDNPFVAGLKNGGFIVGWESSFQDGSGNGIYAQRFNFKGEALGGEFRVNTQTIGDQDNISIAALNDGGFIITWRSDTPSGIGSGIYAQHFNADGEKLGDEFLVSSKDEDQMQPLISGFDDGGFVVGWHNATADGGITVRKYDGDGIPQQEFLAETENSRQPSITTLKNGGFVVSWTSKNGPSFDDIHIRLYDINSVALGSEFRVNTYLAMDQNTSKLVALNNGGFVVIWQSWNQDSSFNGIYARLYDGSGIAQGDEFLVNTLTNGEQQRPSVTALNDGGFVVTWDAPRLDEGSIGIFGKRYDTAGNEIEWITPDPSTFLPADRVFNWAENIYPSLFSNHPVSQEIEGYYARLYENGNALGELNENIYFYNGQTITLVGSLNDFLPEAIETGF